jgi:hypothetical protein
MKKELTIYRDGKAVLTDDAGELLWSSDNDDDFACEFEEVCTFDDGEDICGYLEDAGYIDSTDAVDIVEASESGLRDEDDDGEEEYEDEEEDEEA